MIFNRDDVTSPSTSPRRKVKLVDAEFGVIAYRRSPQSRFVRLRVTEDGHVRATLPKRAPLYLVKELIESSRDEIRTLIGTARQHRIRYVDGMEIGHSHTLRAVHEECAVPRGRIRGQTIEITLPHAEKVSGATAQDFITAWVKRALRREAMAYLPRRLRHLANTYGFDYSRERFGHQRGRWGSCSSNGTISLNVALMNLPFELIDYVLIHELAHTRQMNHSPEFWNIVEACVPQYRENRKVLKTMSPIC